MQYALLIYGDEKAWAAASPDERDVAMKGWWDYEGWMAEKRWKVAGAALQPTSTARTLHDRAGKTVTTDGPFAETKEQLGGFYLLECGADEAIEAASRIPTMGIGSVEIRPVMEFDMEGRLSQ